MKHVLRQDHYSKVCQWQLAPPALFEAKEWGDICLNSQTTQMVVFENKFKDRQFGVH